MPSHDVVVVGSGLAGMRAAVEIAGHLDVAIVSKVHPARSHSGAAQGGMAAPINNNPLTKPGLLTRASGDEVNVDSVELHWYDICYGGDFLVDQDAAEAVAKRAAEIVYQYDHWGVAWSRNPDGTISQRRFGGHQAPRACYAADRTGHALLHCLWEQVMKRDSEIKIYSEFYVLDLIIRDGVCSGVVVYDLASGQLDVIQAKAVIFASGGYGRAWRITTNAFASTGDGVAMAFRNGLPLEDMEFVQFHPTGLWRQGILFSEGARGEGAHLVNGEGERFMERYAPEYMELAPRDIISRAEASEFQEGRGVNGQDYVYLDFRPIGRERVLERLPQLHQLAWNFAGIDILEEPLPIQPTAHYSMGGIPVNLNGEVIVDPEGTIVKGFYAAGECSCMSVHGANRLGVNSLLEATATGLLAGGSALEYAGSIAHSEAPSDATDATRERVDRIAHRGGEEKIGEIRDTLKDVMMEKCAVFREAQALQECLDAVKGLQSRFRDAPIQDKSKAFNTAFTEAIELDNMLSFAEAIVVGALARQESRGAHFRTDHPTRDDDEWMKHTLAYRDDDGVRLEYKPVTVTKFQPEERKY